MCAVSLGAAAQSTITYPYNPDEDGNGQIAVADLQGILSTYGNAFAPSAILVDGETLTTVLTQLQNSIDSLSGLTGGNGSVLDMPLGTILPIATESVPEGWVLCDGQDISIEEHQSFYNLVGTSYGPGDSAFWAQVGFPATTFNVPDLRGRTIIGANDMGGEGSGVLLNHQASFGAIGGEEMHQLTEAEMPSHSHGITASILDGPNIQTIGRRVANAVANQTVTNPQGGDEPHNNMQPYMALNYMIKVNVMEDVFGALTTRIDQLESQLSLIPFGCTDFTACNFDEESIVDDGSCSGLKGCMDAFASNFNPSATCDDGSCIPYIGMFGFGGVVIEVNESNQSATVLCSSQGPLYTSTRSSLNSFVSSYAANGFDDWSLPSFSQLQGVCSQLSYLNGVLIVNGGDVLGIHSVHSSQLCGTVGGIEHNLGFNLNSCSSDDGNYCSGTHEVRPIRNQPY